MVEVARSYAAVDEAEMTLPRAGARVVHLCLLVIGKPSGAHQLQRRLGGGWAAAGYFRASDEPWEVNTETKSVTNAASEPQVSRK